MSSDSLSIRGIVGLLDLFDTTLYGKVGNQFDRFSFETWKFAPKTPVLYAIYKDLRPFNTRRQRAGSRGMARHPSPLQLFNPSTLQSFNSSHLQLFNSSTLQSFNSSSLRPLLRPSDQDDSALPRVRRQGE